MKKALLLVLVWLLVGCAVSTATLAPLPTAALPQATRTAAAPGTPEPWDGHGLTGHLVVIPYISGNSTVLWLDMATGTTQTLFEAPKTGWMGAAAVAPNGKMAAIIYTPPPATGKQQYSYSDLYLLTPGTPGEPWGAKPLLVRTQQYESFFAPAWSPDGQWIYYGHFYTVDPSAKEPRYQYAVERTDLSGKTQVLIKDALWPAVSPDGSQISYLSNANMADNALFAANADGSHPIPLFKPGSASPVDVHLFSADGKNVIFSMPNPQPTSAVPWWDELFGIQVVSAHNMPSDWYQIAASGGGEPQRLTQLNDNFAGGHLSPDGSHLVFVSMSGVYVLDLSTKAVLHLTKQPYLGSVDWVK